MKKIFTGDEKKIVIFLIFFLFLGIILINADRIGPQDTDERMTSKNDTIKKIIKKSNTPPKININEADLETLQELKGVGPKTALKIYNHREEKGKFTSLTELINVKGIGKKTLAKLLPNLKMIGDSATVHSFVKSDEKTASSNDDSPVNINSATAAELKTLYRVGDVTAQKIIDYRETNGLFSQKEEIMNIKGIGTGTYDRIKHRIIISDE